MRLKPTFGFLFWLGGVILGLFIFYRLAVFAQGEESPKVVINEIAWAGSSVSSADEWIELKNTTEEEIDIGSWQIFIDNPGTDYTITIPEEAKIGPQGFFLIAKYKESNPNSALDAPVDLDREGKAFAISNEGFTIVLKDATGEAMDNAWDGSKPPAGGYGYRNSAGSASIGRKTPADPGSLKESWQEASTSVNFDEIPGVLNLGTPKASNSVPLLPPQIHSISPTEAESDGLFELEEIEGENFSIEPVSQVELTKGLIVIRAFEVEQATATLLGGVKFNLDGAEAGVYDVVVRNPDGQEGRLTAALTIKEKETFDNTNGIIISELLPKPESGSGDEFIEIHNLLSRPVDLKGWKIDDSEGGSSPFQITSDLSIPAFGYLAFYKSETKIALNDNGDIARAIRPDGVESSHSTNYNSARAGQAWALFGNEFKWTLSPTPGEANTFSANEEQVELILEADEIKATSLILNWSIKGKDQVQELSLWQQNSLSESAYQIATPSLSASSFQVSSLAPATTYYFRIKALLKEGGGKESSLIQATTLQQTTSPPTLPVAKFIINEILPRPQTGEEEFIEIINEDEILADLKGYWLKDASGKTFVIGEELSTAALIPPGGIVILKRELTKIYLNDSGGEILQLIAPNGETVSEVSYEEAAPVGFSYARGSDGNYYWTAEPTPGEKNLIITQAMLKAQEEEEGGGTEETGALLPGAFLPVTGLPLAWINLTLGAFLLYLIKIR